MKRERRSISVLFFFLQGVVGLVDIADELKRGADGWFGCLAQGVDEREHLGRGALFGQAAEEAGAILILGELLKHFSFAGTEPVFVNIELTAD